MSVRTKQFNDTSAVERNPVYIDSSIDQREVTVDGYTFHYAPNEVRNFLDDGVGAAAAAYGAVGVAEDPRAFGTSRS